MGQSRELKNKSVHMWIPNIIDLWKRMDWFFSDGAGRELRWVLCDKLEGWVGGAGKEAQKGGHICAHSDSHYCSPETRTML